MREGLQKFLDWAGPDAELAEWGLDDVPVLKQNLFLVGLDENWPNRWYDLQRIFLQAYPRKEGEGLTLESVVDRLGIPKEEPFHNALDDALYTARVCRKLPLAEGLATYPTEEELLTEALLGAENTGRDVQLFMNLTADDWLDACGLGGVKKRHAAVHDAVIRDGTRRLPHRLQSVKHPVNAAGTVQQAVLGMHMQVGKLSRGVFRHGSFPSHWARRHPDGQQPPESSSSGGKARLC